MQDSKFSCLVFVRVEKQKSGDTNFSGGEIIPIGQFFAVGSPGILQLNPFKHCVSVLVPKTKNKNNRNNVFLADNDIY